MNEEVIPEFFEDKESYHSQLTYVILLTSGYLHEGRLVRQGQLMNVTKRLTNGYFITSIVLISVPPADLAGNFLFRHFSHTDRLHLRVRPSR